MKLIFPVSNYVVFDFETTGLNPEYSECIQISAIKKVDDIWQNPLNFFIKIASPLPSIITEITQITDEILAQDGIEAKEAWSAFQEYIEDLPLIGHNVINFDRMFLEKAYEEYDFPIPQRKRYIDTAMLYKAIKLEQSPLWHESHYDFASRIAQIRAYGIKYKLVLCCEELGIDISQYQAHRSDSDIAMTNLIYEHFLENL